MPIPCQVLDLERDTMAMAYHRARNKHPNFASSLAEAAAVIAAEAGEVCSAVLKGKPLSEIRAESFDTLAACLRMIEFIRGAKEEE